MTIANFRLILTVFFTALSMQNTSIHPKLAHLSSEQVNTLIKDYYAKKKVTDLIQRFNIDCLPFQLYKLLPPEVSSEFCPNCDAVMVLPRIPQSAHQNKYKQGLYCLQCKHQEYGICTCAYCREANKKQQKSIKIAYHSHCQITHNHIKATDLTLEQAVSLLSLVRCYGTAKIKKDMIIQPSKISTIPFAPKSSYTDDLLSRLSEARLLKITDQSNPKAISLLNNKVAVSFSAQLSLSDTVLSELIRNIETSITETNWPTPWYEQVSELAFAECREFYDFCAGERMFPSVDEKIVTAMLRNLLEDFSTGQCLRIIYSGAQYAADFMVKKTATPSQAASYMVGVCQRWADKARAENWVVTAFRRNFNCPRSMLSYVLYDFVLKTDEEGLQIPIAIVQLPI
ncbi:MAG: hypothetical protein Q7U23_17470 [Methylococcales bacterium]|nr:hypothetical protein [Methylococcales bacterium]